MKAHSSGLLKLLLFAFRERLKMALDLILIKNKRLHFMLKRLLDPWTATLFSIQSVFYKAQMSLQKKIPLDRFLFHWTSYKRNLIFTEHWARWCTVEHLSSVNVGILVGRQKCRIFFLTGHIIEKPITSHAKWAFTEESQKQQKDRESVRTFYLALNYRKHYQTWNIINGEQRQKTI